MVVVSRAAGRWCAVCLACKLFIGIKKPFIKIQDNNDIR